MSNWQKINNKKTLSQHSHLSLSTLDHFLKTGPFSIPIMHLSNQEFNMVANCAPATCHYLVCQWPQRCSLPSPWTSAPFHLEQFQGYPVFEEQEHFEVPRTGIFVERPSIWFVCFSLLLARPREWHTLPQAVKGILSLWPASVRGCIVSLLMLC